MFVLSALLQSTPGGDPTSAQALATAIAEIIIAAGVIAVAIRTAIGKVRTELGAKIDENTRKTEDIQKQFADQSAVFLLERYEALMQLHPECQRCLGRIRRDVFDPLRVQRKGDSPSQEVRP